MRVSSRSYLPRVLMALRNYVIESSSCETAKLIRERVRIKYELPRNVVNLNDH